MVDWTSPGHPKVEVEAEAPACMGYSTALEAGERTSTGAMR